MANTLSAFVPEIWAQEALMVLESNVIMSELIHRDFENEVAQFGEIVHTRRPGRFVAKRKTDQDDVTIQDASATDVQVKLDQHLHTSFLIRDGEESKSFKSLRDTYLVPALESIAQSMDQIILYQAYDFLDNNVGRLGVDPDKFSLLELSEQFDKRNVPQSNRNLVITPGQKASFLGLELFTAADKVGDNGTALREGSLGRKFGWDTFMSQNAPRVATGNTTVAGAVDNLAGYALGTTVLTVDGFAAALTNGSWCTVAGDDTPQMIMSSVGGAIPTSITIAPGLKRNVVDNAVITVYTPGLINNAGGYPVGHTKEMAVDNFLVAPQQGQLLSFGTAADRYGVRHESLGAPSLTTLAASRNLESALVDNQAVGIGPAGEYGFAFNRNCMGIVTRPLALPMANGVASAVANYNNYSIRVVFTYLGMKQGHLVTVDMLAGIKTFDKDMGTVLLG